LEGGALGVYFSSKHKTLLIWGNYKIALEEDFWGFGKVYMNYSNLIYVVVIFPKVKNILTININLSFSKKILFQKM